MSAPRKAAPAHPWAKPTSTEARTSQASALMLSAWCAAAARGGCVFAARLKAAYTSVFGRGGRAAGLNEDAPLAECRTHCEEARLSWAASAASQVASQADLMTANADRALKHLCGRCQNDMSPHRAYAWTCSSPRSTTGSWHVEAHFFRTQ